MHILLDTIIINDMHSIFLYRAVIAKKRNISLSMSEFLSIFQSYYMLSHNLQFMIYVVRPNLSQKYNSSSLFLKLLKISITKLE